KRLFAYFVFFFQAEDGIRDFHVTGVQTCALPIFNEFVDGQNIRTFNIKLLVWSFLAMFADGFDLNSLGFAAPALAELWGVERSRSEERRVGKEWRSPWSPARYIKKGRQRESR